MALLLAAVLAQNEPFIDAVVYLLRHEGPRTCSCAPEKPGDPGRIVAAFIAAGYSHLSEDVYEGRNIGKLQERLLRRIAKTQREDGLFYPDDAVANAWMAFAITEIYGMTGHKEWKDPARRAVEAIQGMPGCGENELFLQALVVRSAYVAELIPNKPDVPPAKDPDTPLGIAKKDHRLFLGLGHTRKIHVTWRDGMLKRWLPRQRKDGCGKGSWENSVEATSYLLTALGRWCGRCRLFGNTKD